MPDLPDAHQKWKCGVNYRFDHRAATSDTPMLAKDVAAIKAWNLKDQERARRVLDEVQHRKEELLEKARLRVLPPWASTGEFYSQTTMKDETKTLWDIPGKKPPPPPCDDCRARRLRKLAAREAARPRTASSVRSDRPSERPSASRGGARGTGSPAVRGRSLPARPATAQATTGSRRKRHPMEDLSSLYFEMTHALPMPDERGFHVHTPKPKVPPAKPTPGAAARYLVDEQLLDKLYGKRRAECETTKRWLRGEFEKPPAY